MREFKSAQPSLIQDRQAAEAAFDRAVFCFPDALGSHLKRLRCEYETGSNEFAALKPGPWNSDAAAPAKVGSDSIQQPGFAALCISTPGLLHSAHIW